MGEGSRDECGVGRSNPTLPSPLHTDTKLTRKIPQLSSGMLSPLLGNPQGPGALLGRRAFPSHGRHCRGCTVPCLLQPEIIDQGNLLTICIVYVICTHSH